MSRSDGPSSTTIIIGLLIGSLALYGIWVGTQKCEASGGRYMKTLYNTYTCVYERKDK